VSEVTELYDVILGCCTTNQRTSCITYIHNIYLQWYLQQDPKLFLHHPHDTDRCDLPSQSPKPESPLRISSASPAASPSPLPPISGFQSFSPSLPLGSRSPSAFSSSAAATVTRASALLQRRRQQQIKHIYLGGHRSNSLAAAWCMSNATPVSACAIDISDRPGPVQLHTLP